MRPQRQLFLGKRAGLFHNLGFIRTALLLVKEDLQENPTKARRETMNQPENELKPQRPEAILFDLGGTLLKDSFSGGLGDRMRALRECEPARPYLEADPELPTALAKDMRAIYEAGLEEFHLKGWLESRLSNGPAGASGSVAELERLIRKSVISYSPPDDATRVLRALQKLNIPMAVVSNSIFSSALLRSDIEELSVLEAFQFVVSSAEFGLRKPHAAIFEDAVKRLGSPATGTWYVGDTWEADVVGSSGAGLVSVWLTGRDTPPPASIPHIRAKNWAEFGNLLDLSD